MDPADSIDTLVLDAGNRGWAGVTNRVKPALVGDDQLTVLINGLLDDTGSVQLRPGTEWLGRPVAAPVRAMAYFDIPGAEAALVMANGNVYELPADRQPLEPLAVPGVVLSTSGPYETAKIVDKLAIADGLRLQGLWREDGQWRTMQVATFSDGSLLPPVQHALAHAFRLFITGGRGVEAETIYGSDVLDPWTISNTIGIRVGRGEGDAIVRLMPGPGQKFYALKGGSCWWIDTTGSVDQWQCDAVTMQLGCWAGATAVAINQDVIFLSRRGVAQLGRLSTDAPVAPADLLSAPIQATMDRINWSVARRTACATLWREYYLLAVPLDGAAANNTILAYNTATKQWSGEWTGLEPTAFCQTQFEGLEETLLGTATGDILRFDPVLTADESATTPTPICVELETRAYDFGAGDIQKIPHALDAEWRNGATTVDVTLRADGGAPQTIAEDYDATATAGTANRRLIANLRGLTGGRELQIRMVSTGDAFGLRELKLKALPLRARWEAPPAELLVPPVPADDLPGTPTTLRDGSGRTMILQLQEIDTITLPHDSLEFACFRGGLSVPAGSYVLAYREGSFTTVQDPGLSDLPAPTGLAATTTAAGARLTWDYSTDPRVTSWVAYSGTELLAEVSTPTLELAMEPGTSRVVAIFAKSATDTSQTAATVTATARPALSGTPMEGDCATEFTGIAQGDVQYDETGGGWYGPGTANLYDMPNSNDSFAGIPSGTITTVITGTGWLAAGTAAVP